MDLLFYKQTHIHPVIQLIRSLAHSVTHTYTASQMIRAHKMQTGQSSSSEI